jgi:vitamin B12/bleomycin/antimicrobial peptide transport system ATP-binding/permease protein
MNDQSGDLAKAASDIEDAAHAGLVPQLTMMVRALLASRVRNTLFLLAGSIFLVVLATAYGQIRLNSWNQPFYDALSRRDLTGFLMQLVYFAVIAGALLALNVTQTWLNQLTKLKLREGLVRDLVGQWMLPRRAFRLANAGPIGVNPDQRLHEDARHLTELSTDLGVGLLQSSILLAVFVDVLWTLSSGFAFHIGGKDYSIPGYMVWAAVIYAGSASMLSYWVGHSLIDLNADRYAKEADLRFSLMRVNEHIDAISLSGGEADEERRINLDLDMVLAAMRRLVTGLTNLTWITAGYGWFTLVAPILVAAPVYFSGNLSFGGLMMAVGAFNQVQSSLRWFVDNFSAIADWRATLLRVASFRRAVLTTDVLHDVESRIENVDSPDDSFVLDHLEIASPAGCIELQEKTAKVARGERVLVIGESGLGKTLFFRALAGLWPWGSGKIGRPKGAEPMYMPRTPYLPPGTLREVLAYPAAVASFATPDFESALDRVGLSRLSPLLDTAKRWERELSEDEQQAVAFARISLHKPPWLVIDEVFETLEDATYERVADIITNELDQTGLIHIDRDDPHDPLFTRKLHLVRDPEARTLERPGEDEDARPARAGLSRQLG